MYIYIYMCVYVCVCVCVCVFVCVSVCVSVSVCAMYATYVCVFSRLAPEVALGLHYRNATCYTASDVFMLGTTFWETYNIHHVTSTNPVADERHFAPLSSIPLDQVSDTSSPL